MPLRPRATSIFLPVDQPEPAPGAGDPAPARARWSCWSRAAIVTGLLGIALTQPLLELLGKNPAFFVAGQYSSAQIIQFALIVTIVPAAIVIAVVLVAGLLNRRIGEVVFQLVVFALGALFANVFARGIDLEGGKVALVSTVVGGTLAVLAVRWRPGKMLLEFLAIGNVLFLVSFLFMSPTSDLLSASSSDTELGHVSMETPPGPVVVIVFDELPLSTILSPDGSVNAERYPAFARLEESATWWRNASSDHHRTERAVPELMTGTITAVDALPSYVDLPRNLLTLFSGTMPVERYEPITDLCPPDLCEARIKGSLDQVIHDASVVYGHRVLPRRLRAHLPAIDQAWGDFGGDTAGATEAALEPAASSIEECQRDAEARGEDAGRLCRWFNRPDAERSPRAQSAALMAVGSDITSTPTLHFAHVVLPHAAWTLDPWGHSLMGAVPDPPTDPSDPAYDWLARLQYQRHSLQVGAADVALGSVLDDIEASGAWDDTTIVVMADHGTSTLPPVFGRNEVIPENQEEIYRVPLFIKAPGQTEGEVLDDPAQTIDMLPTLVDVLDVDTDWHFDGHSLLDGSEATNGPVVSEDVQALFDLVARHHAQVPEGEDWTGLAAVGEHADLVGTKLADQETGAASDLQWSPEGEEEFDSLPTADGRAPQTLTGRVVTPDGERPPELVVSVNGTIAGAIGGYYRSGGSWRFGTVLGPFLRDGANEIVAYEVGADGVLHPLE